MKFPIQKHSIQAALVSNGVDTYLILWLDDLGFYADGGYESKDCNWESFGSGDVSQSKNTNTGRLGQYIFKVNHQVCQKDGKISLLLNLKKS